MSRCRLRPSSASSQEDALQNREALNEAERLSDPRRALVLLLLPMLAACSWLRPGTAAVAGSGLRAPGAAAPASCSPAGAAAVLPADVLGALEQRLRDLAREADERGAAGGSAEASYDAVTDEPAPIPTDARK